MIAGESLRDGIYRVDEMVEKPSPADAPSNLAIIGRYILTPDIFDIIRETPPGANGEIQLTDALQIQAKRGCVMAYKSGAPFRLRQCARLCRGDQLRMRITTPGVEGGRS